MSEQHPKLAIAFIFVMYCCVFAIGIIWVFGMVGAVVAVIVSIALLIWACLPDNPKKQFQSMGGIIAMTELVACAHCGKDHRPYAHIDEEEDIEELENLKEAIALYPSTVTENEIFIRYPRCRDCYIEIHEDPAPWDEEWLQSTRDTKPKVKT